MVLSGIHHLTALAGDPQNNLDFYTQVLGFRLVKQTVNFDAPGVYHFYYGDQTGSPGTILTFFPFPRAHRGSRGVGEVAAIAGAVPTKALGYWTDRLTKAGIVVSPVQTRFGESWISFEDPDGLVIELVASPLADQTPASSSSVPAEYAIRKFHGVTFLQSRLDDSADFLTKHLGFTALGEAGGRHRYAIGEGTDQAVVDILVDPSAPSAHQSAGSVHHIAWRVDSDATQLAWQNRLGGAGFHPTPVMDRNYFNSIYFREPGGILFEIATDPPGFAIDEPLSGLGTQLKLPEWLEAQRAEIERILPPIRLGPAEV